MATANAVLTEARRWLGTSEQPAGSNNVPGITDWYGVRGAWCAMFISRVFWNCGMPLPASTPKGFAWVSAGFDWFRREGWYMFTDYRQALPGDLIAWEWGSTAGGYDHISMVESNGPFVTIGGNERDRVKREFYGFPQGAALFARPPFDPEPIPVPPVLPPIPSITTRKDTMRKLTNTDGRVEIFDLNDKGQVVNTWQRPDGSLGPWALLNPNQPGAFTSIDAFAGPDGRLCVIASGPPFGVVFISSQPSPNGSPWTNWVNLSDLLKFLHNK